MEENITETLKAMIDTHGLLRVVTALELICGEKAEILSVNLIDKARAKIWASAGKQLRAVAQTISYLKG